jgi:hypothetical protein
VNMEGRPLPVAPRFGQVCGDLPAAVAELLDRAIGHDPSARPTARELAVAMRAATEQPLPS